MNEPRKALRLISPAAGPAAVVGENGTPPTAAHATGIVAKAVSDGVCPKCGAPVRFGASPPLSMTTCAGCGATFLVPGQVDGFLLLERIGVGEMGEIYRARDESLNRDVAIKVVRGTRAADEGLRERLRQEAQAAARLSHPRVAQVHALGFSGGHPYLVMELVCGEDMDVKLRREGRIDERTALQAAGEVVEGLNALHRLGLTHGDIKPANIVLDADGAAKLVDFGLSGMSRHDGTGAIHGTPHYIAPELLRGAPDSRQTDLYSLGATLYHLLAGKPPFDGETPADVVRARLAGPAKPISLHAPSLSSGTQRLVARLLEANPAQRYPDCAAVTADIQSVVEALNAAAQPPSRSAATDVHRAPSRRRRLTIYAILSGIAATELFVLLRIAYVSAQTRRGAALPGDAVASAARPVEPAVAGPTEPTPSAESPPAPQPPVFVRRLTPKWFSANLGSSLRGSTVWRNDTLIVLSDGFDLMNGRDDCRYVHAGVTGDFSVSAEFASVATAHDLAKTGFLLRIGRDDRAPGLFFGVQGDSTLVMLTRDEGGDEEEVRASDAPVFLPCRLRIMRYGDRFVASVSQDGDRWQPFAKCTLSLPAQIRVGFAVASHVPGGMSTAEFRDIALLVP